MIHGRSVAPTRSTRASSNLPCTYSFLMYTSLTPPLVLPLVRTVVVPPVGVAACAVAAVLNCASVVRFADQMSLTL